MNKLRTLIMSGAVAAAALLATAPAQAAGHFVIGPHGVRIYVSDDRYDRYDRYDRGYYDDYRYRDRYYRPCRTRVSFDWRYGRRVRVVDRICYRHGRAYIADRDYYGDRYRDWY